MFFDVANGTLVGLLVATRRESKHKILILYEYYNNHHPTRLEMEMEIQMEE
jgi:hypothetical protein